MNWLDDWCVCCSWWECRVIASCQAIKNKVKGQSHNNWCPIGWKWELTCSMDRKQAGSQKETLCNTKQEGLLSTISLTAGTNQPLHDKTRFQYVTKMVQFVSLCVQKQRERLEVCSFRTRLWELVSVLPRNNPNLLNSFTQHFNRHWGLGFHCVFAGWY